MILLQSGGLERKDAFRPETQSLEISERTSSTTLTVGPDAPEIPVGSWLLDEHDPGAGTVWRVKTVDTVYDTETRTLRAEHVISLLKDRVLFGEVTPATITGDKKATKCTVKQAVSYILKQQDDWKLGDVEYTSSAPYSFNGDTLYAALETISSSLKDCWWEYDLTKYPFRLHIRKQSTAVETEMRRSRNITSLKVTVDRSRMYTRHYPIGKNNLKLSGSGYTSKKEAIWGIVSKVETESSLDTEEKLRAWSQERLERHCDPVVTVTISGIDYSQVTGEPLDRIRVGRMCRVPLPEYKTVITERIVKISWSDKLRQPEICTVTLANELVDVAKIINSSSSSSSRGARAGAKKDEEDHAWMIDEKDHVEMLAEAVAGEGASKDWSRVSSIKVDGKGIHQHVTAAENKIVTHESRIEMNEKRIAQEVEDRKNGDDSVIEQTASKIDAKVNSAKKELRGELKIESDRVSLLVEGTGKNAKIKPAGIVASINEDGDSNLKLVANHIDIDGIVESLEAKDVMVQHFNAADGEFTGDLGALGDITAGGDIESNGYQLKIANITVNGNVMHVTKTDGTTLDVTFRGAATLQAEYGGSTSVDTATYTVTAKQSGAVIQTVTGSFTVHQNKTAAWVTNPGGTILARIDNPQYGNGWAAARARVSLPTSSSTAESFQVSVPPAGVDQAATTETYTLSNPMNNVAVVKNGAGTIVARFEHGKYDAGWAAAYGRVSLPTSSSTAASFNVKTPPASVGGAAATETYTLSNPMNNVAVVKNGAGTIVARFEHGKYDAGWAAAYGRVSLPTSSSTAASFNVKTPPASVGGAAATETYTLSNPQNNVAVVKNKAGTIVARFEHKKYDAGWAAAYAKVSLPTSSSTAASFQVKTPPQRVGGAAETETYTLSSPMNNVTVAKNGAGTIVARFEHGKYDAGYVAGWNAARAKIARDGNVILRPKVMTSAGTDPGTETAFTATLNTGSAWGRAKSMYRIKTPGGTGAWTGTKDYEAVGEYPISSTTTLEYRASDGYWGWRTEPSITWT